jgi:four helix bundle suffix protein
VSDLILPHGGYRQLKTFILSRLIFDITVRFCKQFMNKFSRTNDQMVQAARSGVQNIAEGSQAAGTSKKTEMKLTSVSRSSLEELKLDYEDFLRQHSLTAWAYADSRRKELIAVRIETADQFALWVKKIAEREKEDVRAIAANGILVLLDITCVLLDRQIRSQASAFKEEGGFTERLYKQRMAMKKSKF